MKVIPLRTSALLIFACLTCLLLITSTKSLADSLNSDSDEEDNIFYKAAENGLSNNLSDVKKKKNKSILERDINIKPLHKKIKERKKLRKFSDDVESLRD